VLSGYSPEEFVADLKQKGVDGFLELPFEEDSLLEEVAGLLSQPTPCPVPTRAVSPQPCKLVAFSLN